MKGTHANYYLTERRNFEYLGGLRPIQAAIYTNVIFCALFACANSHNREAPFNLRLSLNRRPNPGNHDYRTYSDRYGVYKSKGSALRSQGMHNDSRLIFKPINPNPVHKPLPGILAGWREDLQGKERRDSQTLERDVFVKTHYGQVQGFKVYIYDNPDPRSFYRPYHSSVDRVMGECSVFLGIPYALPPTFEGRFKPPRIHPGWQLHQAVDFGPTCPQPLRYTSATKGLLDMDEDCLFLNVFSPKIGASVSQKYPVMVYIHGGEFLHGASNLFPAHILSTFYDVIVVTLNYRLGALGFLSTADENSPGNYGILDQAMALKWIYDNIEFFNGDRESITLFGPGAGAASAGILMVAPQTKSIVKKVIAQSGSALADWALIKDKYRAQNTSRVLGQLLGCSVESSWKLVNCLRTGRSFYELGNAELSPQMGTFPWGPVFLYNQTVPGEDWYEGWHEKDWKLLPETPEILIQQNNFNRGLHYMTGLTTQEAAYFLSKNESLAPLYEIDNKFLDQKIREHVLQYNYTLNPEGVYEAIKYMYTYWPDPNNMSYIRNQYINMLSDVHYHAPIDKLVKLLLEKNISVYMYVLNTTVEALDLPNWQKYQHDIEYYFLTGAPFMDVEFFPNKAHLQRDMWTDNDRNMSHFFMKTFSNFARYGKPTPEQVLGIHFKRAHKGELRYLNINTTYNSSILLNYRQRESAFWNQYLPTVIGTVASTYLPTTEYWCEPKELLQIAFWSSSIICFLLLILVVICCIMWRNAKRQTVKSYGEDAFIYSNGTEPNQCCSQTGVENMRMVANYPALQSGQNSLMGKRKHTVTKQFRSPSCLAMTSKCESQLSLKSTISREEQDITNSRSTGRVSENNEGNKTFVEETRLLQDVMVLPTTTALSQMSNKVQRTFGALVTPSILTSEQFTLRNVFSTNAQMQVTEGVPQTSV